MRGKDLYFLEPHPPCRITPAYAGKRSRAETTRSSRRDHPRICGEKVLKSWLMSGDVGSPPRMRGKVGRRYGKQRQRGITPAYAGKRTAEEAKALYERDHPRICGEKNIVRKASFDPQGSPPHMRGKAVEDAVHAAPIRITPAYAGKRWYTRCATIVPPDHPRICGEKGSAGSCSSMA